MDGFVGLSDTDIKNLDFLLFNEEKRRLNGIETSKKTKKIHHSRYDEDDFSKIINGYFKDDYSSINEYSSKILQCYKFFRDKIACLDEEEKDSAYNNLFNKLVEDDRKSLVVITLTDKENEQAIFDSINSAGVKLTSSDIIKNAIFDHLLRCCKDKEDVKNFYDDTWFKSFENTEEVLNLWMRKKTIGKSVEKNNLELFLQTYAVIKGIYKPTVKGYKLEDLSLYYKDKLRTLDEYSMKDFIRDICSYADKYREYFIEGVDEINEHGVKYYDNDKSVDENAINRILQILTYTGTSTFDPLVLKIIVSGSEVAKRLKELECYIVRNFVYLGQTDKNYNKECAYLLDESNDVAYYLKENNLSDTTLENRFKNMIKNNAPKLVLFWVELYKMNKDGCDKANTELKCDFTLEHVLPQSPDDVKWPLDFVTTDEFGNPLEPEIISSNKLNALKERGALIYEIGNMTLLPGKKNTELSNESFINKKYGFINKKGNHIQGYNNSCKCLITNDILWPVDESIFL